MRLGRIPLIVWIICASFLVRLIFAGFVWERVGLEGFETTRVHSDAAQYIELTKSILKDKTFTLYGISHSFRTPGYPLWLAFWYGFSGSWFFAVGVVGSALGALSVYGIYKIGLELLSPRYALYAAVLFAFEPYGVHMASRPMTESLYAFLIVGMAWLFLHTTKTMGNRSIFFTALTGLVVGFSILVRPQMWPFFVVISPLIVTLALLRTHGWKIAVGSAFVLSIVAALTVSPWIIRNKAMFGVADVSSQGGWNLYFYFAKRFTGADRYYGLTEDEVKRDLDRRLGEASTYDIRSIAYQPLYYKDAFDIILAHPVQFGLWHIKEGLVYFYDDGLRDMLRHIDVESEGPLFRSSSGVILGVAVLGMRLVWCALFIFFGVAVYRDFFNRQRGAVTIFFAFLVLYVPVVAGTLAVARFRFALTPLLFLLAVRGYTLLRKLTV
ncbi:MAG: glycosyltransferase family 39 protein [Patescibacteria group bacterium]